MKKIYYGFSVIASVIAVLSVFALDNYGNKTRVFGQKCTEESGFQCASLTRVPLDAYAIWKGKGVKGRVIVAIGRRLNFSVPEKDPVPSNMSFPFKTYSISSLEEKSLRTDNFLRIAMETGIAREIVYVLPDEMFNEKMAYARSMPGVTVHDGTIHTHYLGAPRLLTTFGSFRPIEETVLLFISASVMRDYPPDELLRRLRQLKLTADSIVVCEAEDDLEVTARERSNVAEFYALLKGNRND